MKIEKNEIPLWINSFLVKDPILGRVTGPCTLKMRLFYTGYDFCSYKEKKYSLHSIRYFIRKLKSYRVNQSIIGIFGILEKFNICIKN